MQLLYPENDAHIIKQRLAAEPQALLIICYCAAWCRACGGFEEQVKDFAQSHPEAICLWIDIETHEDLLVEEDLENLPSFLIQKDGETLFYAPLPPMIEHIERLYEQAQKGLLTAPGLDYPDFSAMIDG